MLVLAYIWTVALTLIPITFAAKGPITSLKIVNKKLAPDGFLRS
jgi:iron transport multicopper oxidase